MDDAKGMCRMSWLKKTECAHCLGHVAWWDK